MPTPLVSVIVPCYNHDKFVGECIESIIGQDYPNIELIIIDDGSNDHSVSVIESYIDRCKERFVRFEFRHRPNKGLCPTLNEALLWVEGEYLATVASDDIWVKEKTSIQVEYLNNHPETVAVFGSITLIDENNQVIEKISRPFRSHLFEDIFLHNFYIPTPTNLSRTLSIKKVGGFNESYKIEDWLMWLKLAESGSKLDCIETTLAFYRRHNGNISSRNLWMHEGRLEIVNNFKKKPQYKKALKKIYYIALNEISPLPLSLIISAIRDIPSFIFSYKFWKSIKLNHTMKKHI